MAQDEKHHEGWQVTVPASSANLGCAFDCAGLALQLYLRASYFPSPAPEISVEYQGRNPDRVPEDSSNLLLRSMQFAASQLGSPLPQGHILIQNGIPVGAGLGSSAAAVIGGLMLGARHSGASVSQEQLLGWALQIEGHVDNAAAAYCGGLVFAMTSGGRVMTFKTGFPESLRLVVVAPDVMVPTGEARRVLPRSYDHAEVMHTLQRAVAFAATCGSGKFDLFPEIFDDRLHQPYRRQLVPGMERCLQYRHEGLRGVVISGSGSAVLAFVENAANDAANDNEAPIAAGLRQIFEHEGVHSETIMTSVDNQGAILSRTSRTAGLVTAGNGDQR
ncbi:MAG TPA: homoserine kinase [Candidatus Saccharimonadales bacterium]|jgi:homoserine kinase|nr:homoserine kinase [Candidatus Saccharimonadales bacterium]